MAFELGVLFALGALVCWGLGDFLFQKSSRKFGNWETIFNITLIGSVIFAPFVLEDLKNMLYVDEIFFLLAMAAFAILMADLFHLEALKKGKLSVIEPFLIIEVPIAAVLAFLVSNEILQPIYIGFMAVLLTGLVLISMKTHHFSRKTWIEGGTVLALAGAFFLGLTNFLVGFASRLSNPISAIWFLDVLGLLMCLFYFISNKKLNHAISDFKSNPKLSISMGIIGNTGWILFAAAVTMVPIGIATALSEGYIALAALLGILINKEVLLMHQKAGLVMALTSAIAIVLIYG